MTREYTDEQAIAGIDAPNCQRSKPGRIRIPAMRSRSSCPSLLPFVRKRDFRISANSLCAMCRTRRLELKSLKMYTLEYRNLGIFYENVDQPVLAGRSECLQSDRATIVGEFTPRGGFSRRLRRVGAGTMDTASIGGRQELAAIVNGDSRSCPRAVSGRTGDRIGDTAPGSDADPTCAAMQRKPKSLRSDR